MNRIKEIFHNFTWKKLQLDCKQAFFQLFGLRKGLFFTAGDLFWGTVYLYIIGNLLGILSDAKISETLTNLISTFIPPILLFMFARLVWKRMTATRISHWWMTAPFLNVLFFLSGIIGILKWIIAPVLEQKGDIVLQQEEFFLLCMQIMDTLPFWKISILNTFCIISALATIFIAFAGIYFLLGEDKDIVVILDKDKCELVSTTPPTDQSAIVDIQPIDTSSEKTFNIAGTRND